jgi:hypothetical protein
MDKVVGPKQLIYWPKFVTRKRRRRRRPGQTLKRLLKQVIYWSNFVTRRRRRRRRRRRSIYYYCICSWPRKAQGLDRLLKTQPFLTQ